ncbi:MAG TPA: VacJ family lipoprotein [Stellaceae bacterium]|nr:VacJ family lipoprotein [Stellaceae bacterium]
MFTVVTARLHGRAAAVAAAFALCAGCSAAPPRAASANDPLEKVNRAVFAADRVADRAVLKPIAEAYHEHLPAAVQAGVHHVVGNLSEPRVAVDTMLQGKPTRALEALQRLAVNTTVGGVGVFDVAQSWGLPARDADFGETLGVWGVKGGPYLMLPLLGPSNLRDTIGTAVDFALDPLAYFGGAAILYARIATGGAKLVDTRAEHLRDLDALERSSLDFYAALRSAYRQHRAAEIRDAKKPNAPAPAATPSVKGS